MSEIDEIRRIQNKAAKEDPMLLIFTDDKSYFTDLTGIIPTRTIFQHESKSIKNVSINKFSYTF